MTTKSLERNITARWHNEHRSCNAVLSILFACLATEHALASGAAAMLQNHAQLVVNQSQGAFSLAAGPRQTVTSPPSYLTLFKTTRSEWLTLNGAANAKANEGITKRWHDRYCTDELRAALGSAGITVSIGQLLDPQGNKHSASFCLPKPVPVAPEPDGTKIQGSNGYSAEQICMAGLSIMYRRNPTSMRVANKGDHVQIRYARPSDGKMFSYRCKFDGSFILTWDDSLAAPRWYGGSVGDAALRFHFTASGQLVINELSKNEVIGTGTYSKNQLPS